MKLKFLEQIFSNLTKFLWFFQIPQKSVSIWSYLV